MKKEMKAGMKIKRKDGARGKGRMKAEYSARNYVKGRYEQAAKKKMWRGIKCEIKKGLLT
jgi:hypothetical protein